MLNDALHRSLAQELHEAERSCTPIRQFSRRYPEMSIADSYAIQRAWMDIKREQGRKAIGHKIGLTSRAMQASAQITEPDYGCLLDDMLIADGGEIQASRYIVPRIEVEFAFILNKPLRGPSVTLFDVLDACAFVFPALELIDARIEQFDSVTKEPRKVRDTISDNAANGAIITGGRPMRVDACDLRRAGALLYKNGMIEETGLGAAVLNHPANGVAWLANKLSAHDEGLEAGEIVLAGSFTRPVAAGAGDVFHADYGSFGSVSVRFV
jgi:2-oxo-hept-3-ene-1,7-dioate hydratase